ncbi:hypothetical protein, partial [Pseudomonas sp. zjy_11]
TTDIDRRAIGMDDGKALLGRLARHDESSQDKGRAGHTVAKGFTLSYVVTAESADAYRDFTPIPCGSLSHAGVRTHTSAGYDLCPAHTNPNKAKGGWPYRANRLFFFNMSASLRI